MTEISAKVLLASHNIIDPNSDRCLTTLLCRYPRWIHAEGRTHRQIEICEGVEVELPTPSLMECDKLSRNASSSRAIPVNKLVEDVMTNPAIPLFWGKNQRGMQAREENNALVFVDGEHLDRESAWLAARDDAVKWARRFDEAGYHKQQVNRIIEPFSHITVVVSATEWSNFFGLRIHPDAEPHIKILAEQMKEAIDHATVQELSYGQWHLPFVTAEEVATMDHAHLLKISVARCASTSYKTTDGFDMTAERAIALHDKLVGSKPLHASPCEHQAQADDRIWAEDNNFYWEFPKEHANFVGWRQYRKQLVGECI